MTCLMIIEANSHRFDTSDHPANNSTYSVSKLMKNKTDGLIITHFVELR